MAEAINSSLELLPLPANGGGAAAVDASNQPPNLFLNQLLGALSKSSAELSLQAGQGVTELQELVPGLAQGKPLPGKGLPLGGEDLPPAVAQALAVIAGKSNLAPAEGGDRELLPVHLFARSVDSAPLLPGEAAMQATPALSPELVDEARAMKAGASDDLLASELLDGDSTADTEVQIQEGGAAAVAAFSPQQLLHRRLSAANQGADTRALVRESMPVPGQTAVLREPVEQPAAQAATPSTTTGSSAYNPLAAGLLQQPAAKPDPAGDFAARFQQGAEKLITELQPSIQGLGLSAASSHVAAASAPAREPLLMVPQHAFNDPQWSQAMGNRLTWMMHQGVQTASLQLVPENLGQIQVRVSMAGDMANIEFHARHAHTSDLIESMLPRLTAALDAQGVRVDEVKVHHATVADNGNAQAQNSAQSQADSGQPRNSAYASADASGAMGDGLQPLLPGESDALGLSLLDAYA